MTMNPEALSRRCHTVLAQTSHILATTQRGLHPAIRCTWARDRSVRDLYGSRWDIGVLTLSTEAILRSSFRWRCSQPRKPREGNCLVSEQLSLDRNLRNSSEFFTMRYTSNVLTKDADPKPPKKV